jgi:hypothetical protein
MIGYRISEADLKKLIEAEVPGWIKRAKTRTDQFVAAGEYTEENTIWSEIKVVYMRLQGDSKCVYCERKLESEQRGKAEQDVEHFRPKSSVRNWRVPEALQREGVSVTSPGQKAPGYHRLPYHLFNYSAACKPCNSALKSDCFPIAGKYRFGGGNPKTLNAEKPLLIYPIGDFDADPETLIRFHGVSPQPAAADGHERHRALTTIAFFELDDAIQRKNLLRERAVVITTLYPQLEVLAGPAHPGKVVARQLVDGFCSPKAAHSNCARSYTALHGRDRAEALAIFERAAAFIDASS